MTLVKCLAAYAWSLVIASALAVDRSKFRTCQQTSFCRRHRNGHSARLYQYELVPDSIHFHGIQSSKINAKDDGEQAEEKKGSVWSSLSRRLMGSSNTKSESTDTFLGTEPTLTGTIINVAKETSSGSKEELQWSVHAMMDGIVRMRITETYGTTGSAHEHPRVTYDELVFQDPEEWTESKFAEWVKPSPAGNSPFDQLLEKLVGTLGDGKMDVANFMALHYGDGPIDSGSGNILLVQLKPFSVWLFRESNVDAGPVVVLNQESMMSFEVRRPKDGAEPDAKAGDQTGKDADGADDSKPEKEVVGYWEDGLAIYADGTREEKKTVDESEKEDAEDHRKLSEDEMQGLDRKGLWEESFDGHTDSKPYGPMSVGMDISFPQSTHLYGIPEHASSATLQTTVGDEAHYKEPYRLYNLDVFEYELDETMALYGAVPLVVSHSTQTDTAAVFWFNPSETFVDVTKSIDSSSTHWISESGIVDIFLMPGPDSSSIYRQYAKLTGVAPKPPMFSLGYHQCRWNYKDEKDVYHVHGKFVELDYPYDVLWLDIEHTDGKRYFTWDDKLFPNPAEMQEKLFSEGRRMVTIIDPHIKRDDAYTIHKEATSKGLYIKKNDGNKDYDGWCWPGSSSYLDFTQEKVRQWWAEQFGYNKYRGSTPSLYTWNDMNEPSVFNGPEVSMQKDLRNLNGDEHREWHNLYGMLFQRATAEGLVLRNPNQDIRPFVLSRAFFAGSQRYGAIWTGDNTALWSHLEAAAPMLLSMNVGALSFVGADAGGFFGNPDAELFTRWMQAAAYTPFFRGHAHHDSKRKEPWMFDDITLARTRRASMARYALLPLWYTLFHIAETTGMPVLRMMWMEYPQADSLFAVDNQYLVGSDLLVHPVTQQGGTEVEVLFPSKDIWYESESLTLIASEPASESGVLSKIYPADMDTIPVFQRGGSIISRKLRLRRSALLMKADPYSLFVALDRDQKAEGVLYMDDEETFGYKTQSKYGFAKFSADLGAGNISNAVDVGQGWIEEVSDLAPLRMIERIVVAGLQKKPLGAKLDDKEVEFDYDEKSKIMVVRKPSVSALQSWTLEFKY